MLIDTGRAKMELGSMVPCSGAVKSSLFWEEITGATRHYKDNFLRVFVYYLVSDLGPCSGTFVL